MDLKTAIRITADFQQLLAGLETARASSLRTFRDMRSSVEPARQAWQLAQDEVRKLAQAMGATGTASAEQRQAFAEATAAAGAAKTRYLELRDAVHAQRQALATNADELVRTRAAYAQATENAARYRADQERLKNGTVELTTTLRTMGVAVAGAFGVGSTQQIITLLDQYTQLNARIKMVSSSTEEQRANQQALTKTALDNGVVLNSLGQFHVRAAQAIQSYNMEQTRAAEVTDLTSRALRISGGSILANNAAIEQFAQAIGSGRLQGDELRSISESAPRLAKAIADGIGVQVGRLKDLGAQGALTSQQVIGALLSQRDALMEESARLPLTLSQGMTNATSALEIYVGQADTSAGVSRSLAAGLDTVAKNMDIVAPAALGVSAALGTIAASGAVRMLAGLALGAGPVALGLAAVVGVASAAWLAISSGDSATENAKTNLQALVDAARDFSGSWDEATKRIKARDIQVEIDKTKAAFAGLSKMDQNTAIGQMYQEQIFMAEKAVERLRKKVEDKPLLQQKAALGIADADQAQGLLLDKKQADALNGFEAVYKAFVVRKVGEDGKLLVSAAEVRRGLATMLSGSKTSEDFTALIATLEKAARDNGGSVQIVNAIANAAEARRQVEAKALNDQVAGIQSRASSAKSTFTSMVDQARLAAQLATGIERARADVSGDTRAQSAGATATSSAEVQAAQAAANAQLGLLDQVSARKKMQIEVDVAAMRTGVDAEIKENERKYSLISAMRDEIARAPASEAGAARDKDLAAKQQAVIEEGLALRKRAANEAAQAEATAARRVADVDRATAQERLQINKELQAELVSKANEALAAYRTYAQRVKDLDRQIAANRMDTEASIAAIQRRGMTPGQQADSLRSQLEQLKSEAAGAARANDAQGVLDALSRQKSVAQELAGVKGDGVDTKAVEAEAIANLQRIGEESGRVLQQQRAEAQAAADQQKQTFEQLAAAASRISAEISKINSNEMIRLRAEIDTGSVQSAVDAVRAAFDKEVFQIRIAAPTPLVRGGADVPAPAFATGGAVFGPGGPTSDSIPALLSNGEHVFTAAEVRAAGGHQALYAMRSALLSGWMPRFAEGGAVTRLSVPQLSSNAANDGPLQPMNVTVPGVGTYSVMARQDVAQRMRDEMAIEALKYGRT